MPFLPETVRSRDLVNELHRVTTRPMEDVHEMLKGTVVSEHPQRELDKHDVGKVTQHVINKLEERGHNITPTQAEWFRNAHKHLQELRRSEVVRERNLKLLAQDRASEVIAELMDDLANPLDDKRRKKYKRIEKAREFFKSFRWSKPELPKRLSAANLPTHEHESAARTERREALGLSEDTRRQMKGTRVNLGSSGMVDASRKDVAQGQGTAGMTSEERLSATERAIDEAKKL